MESRYKLLGHPVHPMLIPYPVAMLSTPAVFDVLGLLTGDGTWHTVAFWMIVAGLLVGAVAGVFGLLDWLTLPPGTRAKSLGLLHGSGNLVVLILFALNVLLRLGSIERPGLLAVVLTLLGAALVGITAWLGGELPYRLAVGVDEGAHLDAPNSLSGRPASEGSGTTRTAGETTRS